MCARIRLIVLGERVFGRGLDPPNLREGEHEAPNGLKHRVHSRAALHDILLSLGKAVEIKFPRGFGYQFSSDET